MGKQSIFQPLCKIEFRSVLVTLFAVAFLTGVRAVADDSVPNLEIAVRLLGALGTGGETALPALLLDLARSGDHWDRVWGVHSDGRKPGLYTGRVRQARIGDDRVLLTLQMENKDLTAVEMDLRRAGEP